MEYDYIPLPHRQPLKWPNEARVAREDIAEWYLANHEAHIPNQLRQGQLK